MSTVVSFGERFFRCCHAQWYFEKNRFVGITDRKMEDEEHYSDNYNIDDDKFCFGVPGVADQWRLSVILGDTFNSFSW